MSVQPQFYRGIRQPDKEVKGMHVICPKCKERLDTVKSNEQGQYICPYGDCGHIFKGDAIFVED